jgi:hypothetical protein
MVDLGNECGCVERCRGRLLAEGVNQEKAILMSFE